MRAISAQLGVVLEPVRYTGDDFNGIFDGLGKRSYDAVISGTTITPERSADRAVLAALSGIQSGRGGESPVDAGVSSVAGLRGLTAGIQSGNTSDFVAKRLLAEGAIAGIKYYPYDGIGVALDDLEAGRIGLGDQALSGDLAGW